MPKETPTDKPEEFNATKDANQFDPSRAVPYEPDILQRLISGAGVAGEAPDIPEPQFDPERAVSAEDYHADEASKKLEEMRTGQIPFDAQQAFALELTAQNNKGIIERTADGLKKIKNSAGKIGAQLLEDAKKSWKKWEGDVAKTAIEGFAKGEMPEKTIMKMVLPGARDAAVLGGMGIAGFLPLTYDMLSAGSQVGSEVMHRAGVISKEGEQKFDAMMNVGGDLAHTAFHKLREDVKEATGAEESFPGLAGELIFPLAVPAPALPKLEKVIAKGAENVMKNTAGVVSDVAKGTARAIPVATRSAKVAGFAGAAQLLKYAMGIHVPPSLLELGGEVAIGSWLAAKMGPGTVTKILQSSLKDIAKVTRSWADVPQGTKIVDGLARATDDVARQAGRSSQDLAERLAAKIESLTPEEEKILNARTSSGALMYPDGDSLVTGPIKEARTLQAQLEAAQAQAMDLGKKAQEFTKHARYYRYLEDLGDHLIKGAMYTGVGGTAGAAIGGASAPTGQQEAAVPAAMLGAGLGAAGSLATLPSMVKSSGRTSNVAEAISKGRAALSPSHPLYGKAQTNLDALPENVRKQVEAIQGVGAGKGQVGIPLTGEEIIAKAAERGVTLKEAPEGWQDPKTGESYFNIDRLDVGTTGHEMVGHGVAEALGWTKPDHPIYQAISRLLDSSDPQVQSRLGLAVAEYEMRLRNTMGPGAHLTKEQLIKEWLADLTTDLLEDQTIGGIWGGMSPVQKLMHGVRGLLPMPSGFELTKEFGFPVNKELRQSALEGIFEAGKAAKKADYGIEYKGPPAVPKFKPPTEDLNTVAAAIGKLYGYGKKASTEAARKAFDESPEKDVENVIKYVMRESAKGKFEVEKPDAIAAMPAKVSELPTPEQEAAALKKQEDKNAMDAELGAPFKGQQFIDEPTGNPQADMGKGGVWGLDPNIKLNFKPSAEPRAIKEAAIKLKDGTILTGPSHWFVPDPNKPGDFMNPKKRGLQLGFMTNDGIYLDRQQAYARAVSEGQIKLGEGVFPSRKLGEARSLEAEGFNKAQDVNLLPDKTLTEEGKAKIAVLQDKVKDYNNKLAKYVKNPWSKEALKLRDEKQEIWDQIHKLRQGTKRDFVVVGSGPAGLTAAAEGRQNGMDVVVLEKSARLGGQPKDSSRLRQSGMFGPEGVTGPQLTRNGVLQAKGLGAEIRAGVEADNIKLNPDGSKTLHLKNGETIDADYVALNIGKDFKQPDFPGHEYVHNANGRAAGLEAKNGTLVVVGSGNSAAQAASGGVADYGAKKVVLLSRSGKLEENMADLQLGEIMANPAIEITKGEIASVSKPDAKGSYVVKLKDGTEFPADGIVTYIGGKPKTDWLPEEITKTVRDASGNVISGLDDQGYLVTKPNGETNMPGVFIAGDARAGTIQRAGVAVGEGIKVATEVNKLWKNKKTQTSQTGTGLTDSPQTSAKSLSQLSMPTQEGSVTPTYAFPKQENQSLNLRPTRVNIGLHTNDGKGITKDEALNALKALGITVNRSNVTKSATEPTLVADLSRPLTPEEGNRLSAQLNQEAIAQYTGEGQGSLMGPKAKDWEPFNPEYFYTDTGKLIDEIPREVTPEEAKGLRTSKVESMDWWNKPGADFLMTRYAKYGVKALETPDGKIYKLPEATEDMLFLPAPPKDSPQFKKWFGKSQVVDDKGEPKTVIHGTAGTFDRFQKNKLGSSTGYFDSQAGFFFVDQPEQADTFARIAGFRKQGLDPDTAIDYAYEKPQDYPPGASVMPVYLSLQNPKHYSEYQFSDNFYNNWNGKEGVESVVRQLKEAGYDGVIGHMDNFMEGHKGLGNQSSNVYIAFEPEQIKSAIGNKGSYSPTSPKINLLPTPYEENPAAFKAETDALRQEKLDKARFERGEGNRVAQEAELAAARAFWPPEMHKFFTEPNRPPEAPERKVSSEEAPLDLAKKVEDGEWYYSDSQEYLKNLAESNNLLPARTPQFDKWFEGSEVKNPDGSPKVVFHGSTADFTKFKPGYHGGAETISFSESPQVASTFSYAYIPEKTLENDLRIYEKPALRSNIYPAYLNIQKLFDYRNPDPEIVKEMQKRAMERSSVISKTLPQGIERGDWVYIESPEVMSVLKENGYDGFTTLELGGVNYHVFDPKQVKSALANKGTFDPNTDEINLRPPKPIDRWAHVDKFLTPEEREGISEVTRPRLIKEWESFPKMAKMAKNAKEGAEQRFWYERAAQTISNMFGPDANKFTGLLAALSANTDVDTNVLTALHVWKGWLDAGKPTDTAGIDAVLNQALTVGGQGKALKAHRNNAVRVLRHETADPIEFDLSGPKVDSFYKNLLGHVNEVTNDRHMAGLLGKDSGYFKSAKRKLGVDDLGGVYGKGTRYLAASAYSRELAAKIQKQTGETWTPMQVQAALWAYYLAKKNGTPVNEVPAFDAILKKYAPEGLENLPPLR